ncbi:DUF4158 domain-containing protein [Nocardiopsis sp. EMB25]|uniref:DUF4158 domain-containing protein n=1 Tax=Nocardiopsis sp. EMB25 TaxID=2835867 RepID=UPI003FA36684
MQWGTARMLGVFQADHPTRVPGRAVAFVADQLDVDPGVLPDYRVRGPSGLHRLPLRLQGQPHEHRRAGGGQRVGRHLRGRRAHG